MLQRYSGGQQFKLFYTGFSEFSVSEADKMDAYLSGYTKLQELQTGWGYAG